MTILLQDELAEARQLVEDLTRQACQQTDGTLNSLALSDYADALRYLARIGRVKITAKRGRCIRAEWVD